MTEQRFNLLYEPCIPVVGKGRVSLLGVFEDQTLTALSGTPLQKIALMKFLLTIAQAAATPADVDAWLELGPAGLAEKCVAYLKAHEDCFWLYGPRPFLQMPACEKAKEESFGSIIPFVASGNTTILTQINAEPELTDADKFLLLVMQMSTCLSYKMRKERLTIAKGYDKKETFSPGPAIGRTGQLHSFLLGQKLSETIWCNMLTLEEISEQKQWTDGLGTPPWEKMPESEICPVAERLKCSLMGRLIPMARFCLLTDTGLKFTGGIVHYDHSVGMVDPSAASRIDKKGEWKVLLADPEMRPWRSLPALLAFLSTEEEGQFQSLGLRKGLSRIKEIQSAVLDSIGIWSGGVKVTFTTGIQSFSGHDDELQSEVWFIRDDLSSDWYLEFSGAMLRLEEQNKKLRTSIKNYCASMKIKEDSLLKEASMTFWQLAEQTFQELVNACGNHSEDSLPSLLRRYRAMVLSVYDEACPHDTARQFETWVRNRPFSGRKHG